MTVTINGTTGIAGVDGSAGTPSVQGADSNTGMFFPAADTIAFAEGGTEVVRIDSSGEVTRFNINPGGMTIKRTDGVNSNGWLNFVGSDDVVDGSVRMATDAANALTFLTAATERARIDSSGNLLVGKTTNDDTVVGVKFSAANNGNGFTAGSGFSWGVMVNRQADNGDAIRFRRANADVGSISVNTTNTAYNTSSDYRLKHDIVPMAGALAKVAALKPVAYKWNVDGSAGEGFIAHELAKVCPGAVTGEKDAVDADGNPVYQGIDTSFLVATLTAAIQELRGIVDSQAARIAALEGAAQ
jgi:hypothetical protein